MTAGWHQTSAKSLWQITLHLKALAFQTVSQELNMFNVHQKKATGLVQDSDKKQHPPHGPLV